MLVTFFGGLIFSGSKMDFLKITNENRTILPTTNDKMNPKGMEIIIEEVIKKRSVIPEAIENNIKNKKNKNDKTYKCLSLLGVSSQNCFSNPNIEIVMESRIIVY
jgi:hypothetical protein